jgi:hypothetical protein
MTPGAQFTGRSKRIIRRAGMRSRGKNAATKNAKA